MAQGKSRKRKRRVPQSLPLLLLAVFALLTAIGSGVTNAAYRTYIRGRVLLPKAAVQRASVKLLPNENLALAWENDESDAAPEGYSLEWAWGDADPSEEARENNNQSWLAGLRPGEDAAKYAAYAATEEAAEAAAASLEALTESLEALPERTPEESAALEEGLASLESCSAVLERVNNRRMLLTVSNVNQSTKVSDVGLIYSIRIYGSGVLPLSFVLKEEGSETLYYSVRETVSDSAVSAGKGFYSLYKFFPMTEGQGGKAVLSSTEESFSQKTEWETAAGSTEKTRKTQEKSYQIFVGWDGSELPDGSLRKELERLKVVVRITNDPKEENGMPQTAPTILEDRNAAEIYYRDEYWYLD